MFVLLYGPTLFIVPINNPLYYEIFNNDFVCVPIKYLCTYTCYSVHLLNKQVK